MKRNKAAGGLRAKLTAQNPDNQPEHMMMPGMRPNSGNDDEDEANSRFREEITKQNKQFKLKVELLEKHMSKLLPLIAGDDDDKKGGKKNDLETRLNDKIF